MKLILTLLLGGVMIFSVLVMMQPSDFRIERSLVVNATAETIYPLVNNQEAMQRWSPWAKLDPDAKMTRQGPAEGIGSVVRWEGNMQVGVGTSTLTESRPNEFVQFRLDFEKPFPSSSVAEFTFVPQGEATQVTWAMYGHNDFIGKAVSLVFNCEKMVGEQFEKGLTNLQGLVEGK